MSGCDSTPLSRSEYAQQTTLDLDRALLSDTNGINAGLIFITSNDPVSRLTITITKQEFSSIGFYYTTTITGILKIQVVIMDAFGSQTPDWLQSGQSITDLINNPLISKLAIKRLNPIYNDDGSINADKTKNLQTTFRSAIAQVMSQGPETSLRETISQLFGYRIDCPTSGNTAVEMVNRVISLIGHWDDVPQNNILTLSSIQYLNPPSSSQLNASAKLQLLGYLGSGFNQQNVPRPNVANKQIQSYIVPNSLFGDLIYISLPTRNIADQELSIAQSIVTQRSYLTKAISTFVDMLLSDLDFFSIVVRGINDNSETHPQKSYLTTLQNVIKNCSDSRTGLVESIFSWIEGGKIPSSQLSELITIINNERRQISSLVGQNLSPLNISPINHDILLSSSHPNCPHRIIPSHDYNSLNQSLDHIYDSFNQMISSARDNQTITFNINSIISSINSLNSALGLKHPPLSSLPNDTSYNSIAYTNTIPSNLPIPLSSGDKVVLPLCNADLKQFDRNVLLEILEYLDNLSDRKYDYLRTCITKELAQ